MDNGASFADIPGTTGTSYTATAEAGLDLVRYRAVFSNAAGNTPTAAATLTVTQGLAILDAPANETVVVGQKATFTAFATGSTKTTVQWQVSADGGATYSNIAGATKTAYTATRALTPPAKALGAQDGNLYRAVFTNAAGKAVSPAARLTVKYAVTLGAAQKRTVQTGTAVTLVAQSATKVAPTTVQWQSSPDGKAATYTNIAGATGSAYVATAAGTPKFYRAVMVVSGKSVTTKALTLTGALTATVTTQPVAATAAAGKTTFTAAASPKAAVQWQYSTDGGLTYTNAVGSVKTTSAGTTSTSSTLTLTKLTAAQSGRLYRAVFATAAGDTESVAAALTV